MPRLPRTGSPYPSIFHTGPPLRVTMALRSGSVRCRACTPAAAGAVPRRALHVAGAAGAWQKAGSGDRVRLLLNDMQHAPGCQCHGCGIGGATTPVSRGFGAQAEAVPDYAFEMAASSIRYGRGVTAEVGMDMENLGCKNVMLITDKNMAKLPVVATVRESLDRAGRNVCYFDDVAVEPTGSSFQAAIDFARDHGCEAFVSVGGGSVMDTAKAANLFATFPEHELLDFVNAPVGKGLPVPGQLLPHIAIPTTAGTGSETTGQAIFDYEPLKYASTSPTQPAALPAPPRSLRANTVPCVVQRQDRHRQPCAQTDPRHHRSGEHGDHAEAGRDRLGLRRAVPLPRVVHRHPVQPAHPAPTQPQPAPGLPGVKPDI